MRNLDREEVVGVFHKAFKHPIGNPMTSAELSFRYGLIFEEFEELKEEIAAAMTDLTIHKKVSVKTTERLLKEMADLQYVLSGMAVAFGLPLQQAFVRVHNSNMSKLGEDGQPIYREDGKVLKGPNYAPPDLEDLIDKKTPMFEYHKAGKLYE